MTDIEKRFRPARIDEADVLAELVDYAGEGLPSYLWGKMAGPGETAQEVGRRRAARETGTFSYRNATMIEYAGHTAGSLISYVIPDAPEPVPSDVPAMLVPLQELENRAPGTWNVNVLGVLPQFRNLGLGTELLRVADESARKLGKRGMSIIVSDANIGACRLYERLGYREVARRTMVKEQWVSDGHEWVLLIKLFCLRHVFADRPAPSRCPYLARLRHADLVERCLLAGVHRKTLLKLSSSQFDP